MKPYSKNVRELHTNVFLSHNLGEDSVNHKRVSLINCKKEFIYASEKQTRSKMIPVVMEECMLNSKTWRGLVGINLCREMYVDMSGDLEDNHYLSQQMELLKNELQSKGIHPGQGMLFSYFFFQ